MRGENISMKNKILILLIAVTLIFMIGSVSAVNETDIAVSQNYDSQESVVEDVNEELPDESSKLGNEDNLTKVKTSVKSEDTNIVKGKDFTVQLTDSNSTPVANKTITFKFNNKNTKVVTDNDGFAKLKINVEPGTYTVKYSFSGDDGYSASSGSTKIFVISSSTSKIAAKTYTAFVGLTNIYTVTLTAGDTPLSGRVVVFKINGKTYNKKTNSKGQAKLSINLPKANYRIKFSYAGEKNIKSTSGSSQITVLNGMPTKMSKANSVIYRNKKAGYFKVKLLDMRNHPLKSANVKFKLKGKTYVKKTNANGIASLKIKLKTGNYKIKAYFSKTSVYKQVSKTYTVKVKPKHVTNNGMWLFGKDMKAVNFNTLKKHEFKHVFLNFKAVELYGKSGVENWIKQAKSYGIKVHLWMQVFYGKGNWQNPVRNGGIDYDLINSKVKEAKSYAKIKGVTGVHFDYLRYPGNAYQYKNSINAVNTFVKKAANAVHSVNKKLIVSAAVMPEPSSMKTYYAQDIRTMGKYFDAIVPMVYKGNYNAGRTWIKWVTQTFDKQSSKAQIWTGLQSYRSDSSLNKLSATELMGDADAAVLGGAKGVILFRFGLFNFLNFKEL